MNPNASNYRAFQKGLDAFNRYDFQNGREICQSLAKQGNAGTQRSIAEQYRKGEGVTKDVVRVLR